jgi:hypothetical protein
VLLVLVVPVFFDVAAACRVAATATTGKAVYKRNRKGEEKEKDENRNGNELGHQYLDPGRVDF